MTRSGFVWFALLFAAMSSVSVPAGGVPTPELGVRVPFAGFASLALSDGLRLEASAVIPGFSAPLVSFEGRLAAKLYPLDAPLEMSGLSFRPYAGAGVLALYSDAVGALAPGLVGLAGVEHPVSALPLTVFLEGSAALLMSGSAPTLAFELGLGARFSFAP